MNKFPNLNAMIPFMFLWSVNSSLIWAPIALGCNIIL
jgi:hypothetical protein